MHVRPSLALAFLLLPSIAFAQTPRDLAPDSPDTPAAVEMSLESAAAGGSIPLANRPLPRRQTVNDRLLDRPKAPVAAGEYALPEEFGVIFEYDGGRVALAAAGIRVVSQVGTTFTARMNREEVGRLKTVRGLRSARLARYLKPMLNVSGADVRVDLEHAQVGVPPTYNGRAGASVIVGDVDSGIDFTRPDFKDNLNKTRILYIWDQTDLVGPSPAGFAYGSEWTKTQIDNTPGVIRQVDDDGHGTAVAGVLIGTGAETGCAQTAYRYVGMAPLAQFIEVKTDFSDAGIIDGVNYVFQKAAALGKDAVVNLSLGGHFGPHDGSDTFSSAISALTGPGRIVVASAGNDQEDKIHGKLITTSTTVGVDRFTITVPPYTRNPGTFNDYFLVTGWYDPTASYTIRVRGPGTADTVSVGLGGAKDRNTAGDGKIFVANQNATYGYTGTPTGRQFEVEVYDSVAVNSPKNGTWEIDVVSNGPSNIGKRVDIWIYASQVGANFAVVNTGLDNTTLVGGPADGDSVFAVGAHATKASWFSCAQNGTCAYVTPPVLNAIASFSNVGPRRDGVLKPEITAPGFGVATTHSVQAGGIGTCGDVDDGVHEIEAGTSFSAPHVAGAAALFLGSYPGSSPSRIKQSFETHARTDAFTGVVPNTTWGYGKLDIYGTFDHAAPTAAVTSPVGGESWLVGSSHSITWTASDNVGVTSVDLDLSLDGGGTYPTNIASAIPNTGSYGWTVPATPSATARVRVTARDAVGNTVQAASPANFAIAVDAPPSVAVVSPNGGESLPAGSSQPIQWTASDDVGVTAIDLDYSTDGGATYPNNIATGLANSGSYAWSVPNLVNTTARVRVTAHDTAAQTAADASDANFAIVDATPPVVQVLAPNGGESWAEGSTQSVTWTATDAIAVDSVAVEYSVHGAGGPWLPVASGLSNSGLYSWLVPAGATDSALVRVTAFDPGPNAASDVSDTLFTITGTGVDVPGGPLAFALVDPTPNPARGSVRLGFRLPATGDAVIEIFAMTGQRVWSNMRRNAPPGETAVVWNGRDSGGALVPAGLYFERLTTPFGVRGAKLVRMN